MASLLSELERFEQEMKDLGSEPSSSSLLSPPPFAARVNLPPPPPPPRLTTSLPVPPNTTGSTGAAFGRLARPPTDSPAGVPPSVRPLPPPPLLAQGPNSTSIPPAALGTTALPTPLIPPGSQYSYSQPPTSFIASPVVPLPSSSVKSVPVSQSSGSYFPVPFHLQQAPQTYQQAPQYQQAYQQGPVQYTSSAQLQSHTQTAQPAVVQAAPQPTHQYQAGYQPAAVTTIAAPAPTTQAPAALAPEIFAMPQQQQAQQLFQRDAQTITPEALESVKAALASGEGEHKSEARKRAIPRKAAGQSWEDPTLADWPQNDHRLFCGDLGNEVNDEVLTKAFTRFPSFNMARVVRDKRTGKTKGYGFVSFSNPSDLALAFKEMNGKYVGNRPIKLRKSTWKERTDLEALDRHKNSKRQKSKKTLHK